MPYKNPVEQAKAQRASEKRLEAKPIRVPIGPVKMRTPRQIILALEASINRVLADPSIDILATNRAIAENARVASMILASNIDAKIDALEAQMRAALAAREADKQLALTGDVSEDEDGAVTRTKLAPLAGLYEDVESSPAPPQPKRPRGRPKKVVPRPILQPLPNSDDFNAALSDYIGQADEDS